VANTHSTEPGRAGLVREIALAEKLADVARRLALEYFRRPLAVETKLDLSPVTVADRTIETEMRKLIRAEFPTHGIRGEEYAAESGADETWVLDPIDGTKSFITGFPLFGTLIALVHGAVPILGLIDCPALRERWIGVRGAATELNGQAVRTSRCAHLREARLYSTSPDAFNAEDWSTYDRVSRGAALRRFGGDCYIYGLVASGHCDLVIEASLKPHDYFALVPVIEGAGGRLTDWRGAPLDWNSDGRVIAAASESLLAEAVEALRSD
jgi:inositol-phosphate phosphatase/L-galactose 1-phosphate phosphatase/histidinol-phosphatase